MLAAKLPGAEGRTSGERPHDETAFRPNKVISISIHTLIVICSANLTGISNVTSTLACLHTLDPRRRTGRPRTRVLLQRRSSCLPLEEGWVFAVAADQTSAASPRADSSTAASLGPTFQRSGDEANRMVGGADAGFGALC